VVFRVLMLLSVCFFSSFFPAGFFTGFAMIFSPLLRVAAVWLCYHQCNCCATRRADSAARPER
jgi:hypothetical protein